MKRLLYFFLLVCIESSLFGQERFSDEPPSIKVEAVPYVYGQLFQPGYGLSIRTGVSGHTFELAPMIIPSSKEYFGSHNTRIGITSSYYYLFRRNKIFQPYLGLSFTHLRDTHRSIYREYRENQLYKIGKDPVSKENFIQSLIGIQVCIPNNKSMKVYLFGDILGFPIDAADFRKKGRLVFPFPDFHGIPVPRVGAGVHF